MLSLMHSVTSAQVEHYGIPFRHRSDTEVCPYYFQVYRVKVVFRLPEIIQAELGENRTTFGMPSQTMESISWPVCTSHNLMVLSSLPETIYRPSGENDTLVTCFLCPVKVRMSIRSRLQDISRLCTFHSLIVSEHTETMYLPSGENAA